jgi:hypothetical protein
MCSTNLIQISSFMFLQNLLRSIGNVTSLWTDGSRSIDINSHYGNKDTPVRGKLPVKQLEAASLHVTHKLTSNVPQLSNTGEHKNA